MISESEDWGVKKAELACFFKKETKKKITPSHINQWYNTKIKNLLYFKFPEVFSLFFISLKTNRKANASRMINQCTSEAGIKKLQTGTACKQYHGFPVTARWDRHPVLDQHLTRESMAVTSCAGCPSSEWHYRCNQL